MRTVPSTAATDTATASATAATATAGLPLMEAVEGWRRHELSFVALYTCT
jgi:hypothetical protein